ncbi:unnamed protein product [Brugia pahangi]|uniref:Transposase n=1 Tax=Brugia pahangi TaxID=6280 RepID=A0A0N4TV30_BRUPA|nr:unnamed protein product [Brugia pahangi]
MALHRNGCYVDAVRACIYIYSNSSRNILAVSCHVSPQYWAERKVSPREQAGDLSLFTSVMGRKEGSYPEDVFTIIACKLPDSAMTHRSTLTNLTAI